MKNLLSILFAVCALLLRAQTLQKEVVDGIEWTFTVSKGKATIGGRASGMAFDLVAIPESTSGKIVIPNMLGGYPVTRIGDSAFVNCKFITSVEIPEGVREVGDYVFSQCSSLTVVAIPNSVTEIGNYVFDECVCLTSAIIPEGVGRVGDGLFYNCAALTSVTIPQSVAVIGNSAFNGCSSLTSITLPPLLTKIGVSAFHACSSLTSVEIPDSVTEVGGSAFGNCSSLTSITIPEGVTEIGNFTFDRCTSLAEVKLPTSIIEIGSYAFRDCRTLEDLIIPKGVKSIGDSAFLGCYRLDKIILPASLQFVDDGAFFGVSNPEFLGDVPQNFANSRCTGIVSFSKEYAKAWETALAGQTGRGTLNEAVLRATVTMLVEMETPKTMKITYIVTSELPSVKVRAVAWKDGKRSFANIVPVRTGEGVPKGENVSTNEEHSFVWNVASDWATDLDKVAVEILVQEGTLLPQELVTIPATKTHKAMTITRNVLAKSWLFDALVWCFAEGDTTLSIKNGSVYVNNQEVGQGDSLCIGTDADKKATTLLNFLYGKMGYKVLADEELEYAKSATRLTFADNGLRQVSVKIEEE